MCHQAVQTIGRHAVRRAYAAASASEDQQRIDEAFHWPFTLLIRLHDGLPPCTLAEWAELTAWFDANLERLYETARANWPDCTLDVGDGRRIHPGEIRNAIRVVHPYGGAKAFRSGQTAEDTRRLRERFATHATGAGIR